MSRSKKRKSSPAQAAAARANGSKSQGPTTDAGKARLGGNRVVHGFRSQTVALHIEDHAAYNDHLASYILRYTPQDKPEMDLVGLAASNMWQVMRITAIESALFDIEISGIETELRRDFTIIDEYGRLALAFKKSAGDNYLELLRRYKTTAERAYHRAFEALEKIQKDRPTKKTVETQAAPQPPQEPEVIPKTAAPISIESHPNFTPNTPKTETPVTPNDPQTPKSS